MKLKTMITAASMAAIAMSAQAQTLGTGLHPEDMDLTAKPGTDFYQYATGGWQKAHPLTDEYSRYGAFDELAENNNKQMQSIILEVTSKKHKAGTVEQKIASMYNCVMDSARLAKDGIKPIKADLKRIQKAKTLGQLRALEYELALNGVPSLFSLFIDADIKNSRQNLVYITQGGLTLGQKDYYLEQDEATANIREEYKKLIADQMQHCGYKEAQAREVAETVLRIETRIAKVSKSMTELRDNEANYHKMTIAQLKADYPGIDWTRLFAALGMQEIKELSVGQPEVIREVEQILAEESLEAQRQLVAWHLVDAAATCLDPKMEDRNFAFYGTVMSGKKEQRPRWKRAVSSVEGALGEALGQIYVKKYFPAEAKARMEQLVKNLQVALGERIDAQDWMSDETKRVAHEKLDAFLVKVGYPNQWKDYSNLPIGDCRWENVKACARWSMADMVERKLNKPVDHNEWYMTPQTVNAYYNPTTNEICFPAGILQPPFFDMQADDAFNYGAIGVVIGHEMTHGFDDQGAKFDKEGNLKQWWTTDDTRRFEERIDVMRQYHNNIVVLESEELHANGSFTLGENIADHGGLMISYQALQNATKNNPLPVKDGLTAAQRFFLAYAGVWGQNIRDEEIRKRVKSDPHQLGKWRVNGQMPHMDAWYEAFGITEQDPMYVKPEERVIVW